jgi:hypothetical protein
MELTARVGTTCLPGSRKNFVFCPPPECKLMIYTIPVISAHVPFSMDNDNGGGVEE